MSTPRKTRAKIGVIGLGIIGSRVAANLRASGHQVYVWSRSPHSAPNFLGSVVEVADLCDIIQVFVSDDKALLEVVRTVAAALSPRHILAVHATVSADATRQAAAIVEGQGARYLDAPFTGSKSAAQNRQLTYYIGGTLEALEEVRPVLEASSKKILHVGGIGDASILKVATNMMTASIVQTLAEAVGLVRAAGIDARHFAEALEFNGSRSGTSDLKVPAILAGNYEPHFSLKHMLKDVRLALDLADSKQVDLPVTRTNQEVFARGLEKNWGDLDFCVVARNYDQFLPPESAPTPAPPDSADAPKRGDDTPPPPDAATRSTPTLADETTPTPRMSPIGGSGANQPKKNTLRILRDFFKPA